MKFKFNISGTKENPSFTFSLDNEFLDEFSTKFDYVMKSFAKKLEKTLIDFDTIFNDEVKNIIIKGIKAIKENDNIALIDIFQSIMLKIAKNFERPTPKEDIDDEVTNVSDIAEEI